MQEVSLDLQNKYGQLSKFVMPPAYLVKLFTRVNLRFWSFLHLLILNYSQYWVKIRMYESHKNTK